MIHFELRESDDETPWWDLCKVVQGQRFHIVSGVYEKILPIGEALARVTLTELVIVKQEKHHD